MSKSSKSFFQDLKDKLPEKTPEMVTLACTAAATGFAMFIRSGRRGGATFTNMIKQAPALQSNIITTTRKGLGAAPPLKTADTKPFVRGIYKEYKEKNPITMPIILNMLDKFESGELGLLTPTSSEDKATIDDLTGGGDTHGFVAFNPLPEWSGWFPKLMLGKEPGITTPLDKPYLYVFDITAFSTAVHEGFHVFAFENLTDKDILAFQKNVEEDVTKLKVMKEQLETQKPGSEKIKQIDRVIEMLNFQKTSDKYSHPIIAAHESFARIGQLCCHSELGPEVVKKLLPKSYSSLEVYMNKHAEKQPSGRPSIK